jgi:hypothetical protein
MKERSIVRVSTTLAALVLATWLSVLPARADASFCRVYNGNAVWTLIPSPNDPFGRVLGPATGDFKAATSAYIVTLVANPTSGIITATSALETCHRPIPRKGPAFVPVYQNAVCCLRRDMTGSALQTPFG